MNLKTISAFAMTSLLLMLFQNCDQQQMGFENLEQPTLSDGQGDSNDGGNNAAEEPLEVLDPPVDEEQTGPGDIGDGAPEIPDITDPDYDPDDPYNPPPVSFAGCDSYIEMPSDMVEIPAKDESKICYYKKLMDPIANHSSGTAGEERAAGVISDNHNGSGSIEPFILADVDFDFKLLGPRKVAFSGKFDDPLAEMKIDNYFLIQLQTTSMSAMWAYGTADAEPSGGRIMVNDEPVENFYSFARGGTATVTAIDVSSSVPAMTDLSVQFRALDCGGSAAGSHVYVVFY
ncbi:MAG: hypothetical protein CL677_10785 [Bdellovibrionaceae bacterium]|nr:hypothetical protein [Pseudobdellovibrionaceae bacterium]|tara:strand:+ start:345 stop:1208 length:864 start_codon:yes stop_codon:yes gene_type:complete